ncbi:MAG: GNAT family N-acetyltransferase [Candidatus Gracilibacteria bacterium]|nr:GNAT family N-acetyltransferase [Candidatus Gracilibacteria bacterium]
MYLKILTSKTILDHKESLLELCDPLKKRPKDYWKSLKNSTYIIVAFKGEKLIGASRIVTDMYMCAMIFDVLVAPDYRGKGVGSGIMEKTVKFCREKQIKNVSLVTDPSHSWLPDFYRKSGFTVDNSRGTYMILGK